MCLYTCVSIIERLGLSLSTFIIINLIRNPDLNSFTAQMRNVENKHFQPQGQLLYRRIFPEVLVSGWINQITQCHQFRKLRNPWTQL